MTLERASSVMQNTLRSPRERATEKLTTREVNFPWVLAQPRLRQWLYEKGHQDFFITLLGVWYAVLLCAQAPTSMGRQRYNAEGKARAQHAQYL